MEHLRYPEDLFKAQRYQFQRYHETSASAWFEGSSRWEVPSDPQSSSSQPPLQPPYRLFTDTGSGDTWSLTSVYVPRDKENNLAAYMAVNSDATSATTTARCRCCSCRTSPRGGPLQIANTFATNEDVSQALLPYTTGDADRVPGNLLTVPIGDTFMYVQPVYTRRDGASNFPILRFVLVSYNGSVGIGTSLATAIEDSLDGGGSSTDPEAPTRDPDGVADRVALAVADRRRRRRPPAGWDPGADPRAAPQAEEKFTQADEAQRNGNSVEVGPADGGGSRADRGGRPAGRLTPIWAHHHRGCNVLFTDAGWSSSVARWAHNPEVAGSNPAPATRRNSRSEAVFRRDPGGRL